PRVRAAASLPATSWTAPTVAATTPNRRKRMRELVMPTTAATLPHGRSGSTEPLGRLVSSERGSGYAQGPRDRIDDRIHRERLPLPLALVSPRLVVVAALRRARAEREDHDVVAGRQRVRVHRINTSGRAFRHARDAVRSAADRCKLRAAGSRGFLAGLGALERPCLDQRPWGPVERLNIRRAEIVWIAEGDAGG